MSSTYFGDSVPGAREVQAIARSLHLLAYRTGSVSQDISDFCNHLILVFIIITTFTIIIDYHHRHHDHHHYQLSNWVSFPG